MALGIYKPGQGYWVRVMTAVMLGVVTLAAAAWLFGEGQKLAGSLPQSRWAVSMAQAQADAELPAPGTAVVAEQHLATGEYRPIAEGEVAGSEGTARLFLKSVDDVGEGADHTRVTHVAFQAGGRTTRLATIGVPQRSAAIEPFYVQGSMALVAIVAGFLLTFWLVAAKPRAAEFLIATDMEMKKVNWSTKRDIFRSTQVVIFVSLILSVALFGIDFVFQAFFKAIGILVD